MFENLSNDTLLIVSAAVAVCGGVVGAWALIQWRGHIVAKQRGNVRQAAQRRQAARFRVSPKRRRKKHRGTKKTRKAKQ